jgi:hypothetical protein
MDRNGIRRSAVAVGPWWRRSVRAAAAAFIAYLFVVVLVTASLQAAISGRLGALKQPLDYSTAYAMWRESGAIEQAIAAKRDRMSQLATRRRHWERLRADANDRFLGLRSQLRLILRRVANSETCEAARVAPPQTFAGEAAEAAAMLALLRQCAAGPAVAPSVKQEAARFLDGASEPYLEAARGWLTADRNVSDVNSELEAVAGSIPDLEERWRGLQSSRATFSDLGVLQRIWLKPAGVLAELPPPVVQIVLAFVSGLFGALLVTLVLIVYPKTEFDLTSDKARFGARILLGGLISLCVFVVLGGGTAVLGSGNGFAAGDANYLAFCAIGILAGMFSDRVADWLSERANNFFRRRANDGERHPAGPPASVPDREPPRSA